MKPRLVLLAVFAALCAFLLTAPAFRYARLRLGIGDFVHERQGDRGPP